MELLMQVLEIPVAGLLAAQYIHSIIACQLGLP